MVIACVCVAERDQLEKYFGYERDMVLILPSMKMVWKYGKANWKSLQPLQTNYV